MKENPFYQQQFPFWFCCHGVHIHSNVGMGPNVIHHHSEDNHNKKNKYKKRTSEQIHVYYHNFDENTEYIQFNPQGCQFLIL